MEIAIATVWRIRGQFFFMLVLWGFMEWTEKTKRPLCRQVRDYLIIAGICIAFIPASLFAALIMVPKRVSVGSWNDSMIASTLGRWNLPLAVVSVLLGILGKGRGRWLLVVGSACLVMVWTMALIDWPWST